MASLVNGLNDDSRILCLSLRKLDAWYSVRQLAWYWRPTFTEKEVEDHLIALHKGRFVERRNHLTGLQFAVTPDCLPLPGEGGRIPGRPAPSSPAMACPTTANSPFVTA